MRVEGEGQFFACWLEPGKLTTNREHIDSLEANQAKIRDWISKGAPCPTPEQQQLLPPDSSKSKKKSTKLLRKIDTALEPRDEQLIAQVRPLLSFRFACY